MGGDRLCAGHRWPRPRPELRLGLLGGPARLRAEREPSRVQPGAGAHRAGARVLALPWLLDHGRLRRPRSDGASAVRAICLRRFLHAVRSGRSRLQTPDAVGDTDSGLDLGSIYSFGEDALCRVYVASGGGEVRRLQVEGAMPPAHCAGPPSVPPPPSPPPPPPPAEPPPPPAPPQAKPAVAICRVPRVIGVRLRPAQARIRRASCRVGRIRRIHSARRRGVVISQAPRPASRRVRGTRVHFTVSRGRR